MNDILSNLDRRSGDFIEWLEFEKRRIPLPDCMNDLDAYACRVWAYENIIDIIRRSPNQRIGNMLEKFIKRSDNKACEGTDFDINRYSVVKDEAEWIKDEIITMGAWI